jgi:Flp pilus assembly protein TadD
VSLCHAFVAVPAAPEALQKRRATIERIAAKHADEAEVVQAAGDSLFMSGEYDRSVECYRRVLELQPNHPYVRNNLAMALGEQQKLTEAEAMLAPVLTERPDDPAVLDTQATLALIGKRPEQASAILTKAVNLRPQDAVMRLHLAAAYEASHDADRVRKHLLTALIAGVERQVLTPRDRASLEQLQAAHSVCVVAASDSHTLDRSMKASSN